MVCWGSGAEARNTVDHVAGLLIREFGIKRPAENPVFQRDAVVDGDVVEGSDTIEDADSTIEIRAVAGKKA